MAKKIASPAVNIGIADEDRKKIADGLSHLLADTYTLYLKTHNFHWNVTGPMFNTLHLMFEGQYTELALAVDSIAERIRAPFVPKAFRRAVKEDSGRRAPLAAGGHGPNQRSARHFHLRRYTARRRRQTRQLPQVRDSRAGDNELHSLASPARIRDDR